MKKNYFVSFFAVIIVLLIGYLLYSNLQKPKTQKELTYADQASIAKNLLDQARIIASKPDQEDTEDIQAIKDKITIGYTKAKMWQPDATWYQYRRVFSLPSNIPDQLLKNTDSYYYESHNTTNDYEVLFDRNSNKILRTDINPNRVPKYVNDRPDMSGIKIGPKKALEIAMLSNWFKDLMKSHKNYVIDAHLVNTVIGSRGNTSIIWLWSVDMFDGSTATATDTTSVIVNAKTGGFISQETFDFFCTAEDACE